MSVCAAICPFLLKLRPGAAEVCFTSGVLKVFCSAWAVRSVCWLWVVSSHTNVIKPLCAQAGSPRAPVLHKNPIPIYTGLANTAAADSRGRTTGSPRETSQRIRAPKRLAHLHFFLGFRAPSYKGSSQQHQAMTLNPTGRRMGCGWVRESPNTGTSRSVSVTEPLRYTPLNPILERGEGQTGRQHGAKKPTPTKALKRGRVGQTREEARRD